MEGWAESQSANRDEMIEGLAYRYRFHRHFTLEELIRLPWYYSGRHPVYSHGGPFVLFLLEKYSAEKFVSTIPGNLPCNI